MPARRTCGTPQRHLVNRHAMCISRSNSYTLPFLLTDYNQYLASGTVRFTLAPDQPSCWYLEPSAARKQWHNLPSIVKSRAVLMTFLNGESKVVYLSMFLPQPLVSIVTLCLVTTHYIHAPSTLY